MTRRIVWLAGAMLLGPGAACAQQTAWPDPPVLMSGLVRIWVVQPNPDPLAVAYVRPVATPIPKTVQEKTVGDFIPPPPNPASTGKAAGGFGALSTDVPPVGPDVLPRVETPHFDQEWQRLVDEIHGHFRNVRVVGEQVYDTDLADRLEHAKRGDEPDVLLSIPSEREHFRLASDVFNQRCLPSVWPPDQSPQVEQFDGQIEVERRPEICVLGPTRNTAAIGVAIWFTDRSGHQKWMPTSDFGTASDVAADALRSVLLGQELGAEADPEIAGRGRVGAQRSPPRRFAGPVKGNGPIPFYMPSANGAIIDLQIDHGPVAGNGRFAVVMLRAVRSSATDYGVAHALVVLRKDKSNAWRVLQISPYLLSERQGEGLELLSRAVKGEEASNPLGTEGSVPMGISEAAPLDGDTRIAPAEMWWDNLGGSSLQVVEWQTRQYQNTCLSHLFYVPDSGSRLKTRITARFASEPGTYRWRVWSVGVDGTVVLSPWRTMTIVGR